MPLNLPSKSGSDRQPLVFALTEDTSVINDLKRGLSENFEVLTFDREIEALNKIKELKGIDVLLVSKNLPKMKGSEFLDMIDDQVEEFKSILKIIMADSSENTDEINSSYNGRISYFYTDNIDTEEIEKKIRYFLARKAKEKRSSMRIPFSDNNRLKIDTGINISNRIKNIAENGIFLKTLAFLPQDSILPLKIFLPEGEFPLKGRIVRRDKEAKGVGIQFLRPDKSFRKAINKAMAEQVTLNGLPGLKIKYPFLQIDEMIEFTGNKKIEAYLSDAMNSEGEITVIPSHSRDPVTMKMRDIKPWEHFLLEGEDIPSNFKTSDSIFVSFQSGYATYSFETMISRILPDGEHIECLYPKVLFYSEKRAFQREKADELYRMEAPLPAPFNTVIKGTVADITDGGVSFISNSNNYALLKGTPLRNIKVFNGEDLVREESGEVRYASRLKSENGSKLKYGVQFGIGRQIIHAPKASIFTQKFLRKKDDKNKKTFYKSDKPLDYKEIARRPADVIHIENKKGEKIVGLINYSLPLEGEETPVVIIPPAFGKTKETLFALALTLAGNFYRQNKPLIIIRYDGIKRKGESYKDPEADRPPNEMLNASISQGAEDIKAVLDWVENNRRFKAGKVILTTLSLSALEARLMLRAKHYLDKVDYWISCMGTPELRHLLTRVNCGLDLLEHHQLGIRLGVMPVLGNLVNVDKYMADGLANRIATLDQARDDMKDISIPITWLYGEHDHWVRADYIRDVMGINSEAEREVIPMPLGHNARTSADALKMFGTITSLAYRYLHKDIISTFMPEKRDLGYMMRSERDRIPARKLDDKKEYWRRYLVGEKEKIGFDVLMLAEDYKQLLRDQMLALKLSSDDNLLDLGGGTGNFIEYFLDTDNPLPRHITIADLVPQALTKAEEKLKTRNDKSSRSIRFDTLCFDIELNRYLTIRRFLAGEFAGMKELVDKIENLSIQTAEKIDQVYCQKLHRILRGQLVSPEMDKWLLNMVELSEYQVIMDFNQASRYVKKLNNQNTSYKKLIFSPDFESKLSLPVKPGHYNKVIMSLVLSYIFNPLETLIEINRILAPKGSLVVSSLYPDADASGLFTRLVEKVENLPEHKLPSGWKKQEVLSSIRYFLNDAQALVELEEAGTFDFFDREKLENLLEVAGFKNIQTIKTFGDPPQGYICVAEKGVVDG